VAGDRDRRPRVEFWTHGAYSTSDIDLYLPHGPAVDELFAELGFEKQGRHWVLAEHELFVEAPASFPAEREQIVEVQTPNGSVPIAERRGCHRRPASPVRVRRPFGRRRAGSRAAWGREIDYARLVERATDEGLNDALVELERIRQRVRRGEQVPSYELQEIAKRLNRRP
jgi:hypothetical protein